MANNYFDMTGVVMCGEATPVIRALFGAYNLDTMYPGDGEYYIASTSEDSSPTWASITDSLVEYAESIGITGYGQDYWDEEIELLLEAIATKRGIDLQLVHDAIAGVDFDEYTPDLTILVDLANALDDGHGLTGFRIESSWHCSKPRLFEFGGCGEYYSKDVHVTGASGDPLMLGASLDKCISQGLVADAAEVIARQVNAMLNSIQDTDARNRVRALLSPKI